MTTHRMTQHSKRQLESAAAVRFVHYRNSDGSLDGITAEVLNSDRSESSLVVSSQGPMYYPTPDAAMRAIMRVRPDLTPSQIFFNVAQAKPDPEHLDDAERILEELHIAQDHARSIIQCMEDDTAIDPRHAFHTRALLSRLHMLESNLLASPPVG